MWTSALERTSDAGREGEIFMENREFDLKNDGFTIIRSVFYEEFLTKIRSTLKEIIEYADKNLTDPFSNYYLRHRPDQGVLYDLFQRHPEFNSMARNPDILNELEKVLGSDIFLYENSAVYKPKGRKNGVPFHQDFISRSNEPIKYIAWMAVDNVTKDNGALKVLPGTHRQGFMQWHRVKVETHHDRIDPSSLNLSSQIYIELNAGDVLIFNQLVVHGSDEVHTDHLRLIYRVSYQGFDQIFVPRGTPVVLRGGSPTSLARYWPTPHVPQKAKSLFNRAVNRLGRKLANL